MVVLSSVVPLAVIYSIPNSSATLIVVSSDAMYLELITLGVTSKYFFAFSIISEIMECCFSYVIPQKGSGSYDGQSSTTPVLRISFNSSAFFFMKSAFTISKPLIFLFFISLTIFAKPSVLLNSISSIIPFGLTFPSLISSHLGHRNFLLMHIPTNRTKRAMITRYIHFIVLSFIIY